MVYGDAVVESAAVIEVDDFVDTVGRVLLSDVGERSTVAHDLQWCVAAVEAEEASGALAVKAVALRGCVLAGSSAGLAVDDGLGDQQPVEGGLGEYLVGVQVVALPDAERVAFFGDEVEARVDLVLAVREEEPHDSSARVLW